ncbi:unnamed protein product [Lota lota]
MRVQQPCAVQEGEALELRCLSDGYPPAHRYWWCSERGVVLHSGQLYLRPNNSRRTDRLYCSTTNTQGHAQSCLLPVSSSSMLHVSGVMADRKIRLDNIPYRG